jgi:ABC-type multidrug transport system permease subunit
MKLALSRRAQWSVLHARYLAVTLADLPTLGLLLGQAPLIGALCGVVWGSVEDDTPSLWFVLALASVWFGCINACREVVKERAILERERLFGLSMLSYVASKLSILAGIGLIQVILLLSAVEFSIALRGAFLLELLGLWLGSLAGTGLGLLVSALSQRQERAVGVVPLLLLPQILFSEFAIPEQHFSDIVSWVRACTPVYHTYRVFEGLIEHDGATFWDALLSMSILPSMTLFLGGMATVALLRRQETL